MIQYPISEVIDRISICKLKVEHIGEPQCEAELNFLKNGVLSYKFQDTEYYIQKLYEINSKIWDLEADIRGCKEKSLGLDEIGKRTLLIRDYNKARVAIKNEIIRKSKMGFEDIKINHLSQ